MSKQINVNSDTLLAILRKISNLQEESMTLLQEAEREIVNAEDLGWNDKNYGIFKEEFQDVKRQFSEGNRNIDERLIPFIKQLLRKIEEI